MNKFLAILIATCAIDTASAAGFQPWGTDATDTPDAVQAEVRVGPFYLDAARVTRDTPDAVQVPVAVTPWYLAGVNS